MVEVQAVPVDDLLVGLPPVDVLKMDIEGAELQAFTGLSRTLEASRNISVMFEWAPALMEAVGDKAEALAGPARRPRTSLPPPRGRPLAHRARQAPRSALRERRRRTLMPPDASVVVVSYRPGDWLAPCLSSVLAQADRGRGRRQRVRRARSLRVGAAMGAHVVRSPVNLGFAGGVDAGAAPCPRVS